MTDSRFPERWLNDRRFPRVSAEAQMLFVVGNTWSASNRTDGDIRQDDLALFPRWVHIHRAHELVEAGFWIESGDGWVIAGYASTQTTAAQLDAAESARALDRDRKARTRAAAARNRVSADQEPVRPDSPPDIPRDDTGQDSARTGHVRRTTQDTEQSDRERWLSVAHGYDD